MGATIIFDRISLCSCSLPQSIGIKDCFFFFLINCSLFFLTVDFKLSEPVKIFYSGRELEDDKSLVEQNVHANSVLHLIRTKIHLLPRAQKLPGENKSRRPPGAFKKKSDLSVKDGHVFLMEYVTKIFVSACVF